MARSIALPWYRAQALALIAKHADSPARASSLLQESSEAAMHDDDRYRALAAQAWPIAVAARCGRKEVATTTLARIMPQIGTVQPLLSRCRVLALLWDAAVPLGRPAYEPLVLMLVESCGELTDADERHLRKRGRSEVASLIDTLWHIDRALAERILSSTPDHDRAAHMRRRATERPPFPLFFDLQVESGATTARGGEPQSPD